MAIGLAAIEFANKSFESAPSIYPVATVKKKISIHHAISAFTYDPCTVASFSFMGMLSIGMYRHLE